MTDQDVRDLLERMAAEEPIPFFDAEPLTSRARRRAARTVIVGAVGVAAAIAVLFTGVAKINTAPLLPANQPTPSPFAERFDSPLHGLSIGYPSGWQTRAATEPWGHGELAFGAPDVDVIFDPTLRDDLYLALVSEPLGGKSGPDWVDAHWTRLSSVGICTESAGNGGGRPRELVTSLGGVDGWIEYCDERHGAARGNVVIVATATRGYIIYLHVGDERRLQATYDLDWFKAALETVDLRPEDALDALNPSESPSSFRETFDSPVNGLSIGYPSGWQTRAATEPWGQGEVAFGAPDVDVIFHPTLQEDLYFALVSEPLGGKSGPDWAAAGSRLESVGICNDASGSGGGGHDTWAGAAYAWFEGCDSHTAGGSAVLLATATRGYVIYLHVADDELLQASYDGDWFEAALETVELHPEDALDALNPSESP